MVDHPLLSAHKLTRYYHGRQVLFGIDLELHRGEVLGFLGPNGAGKSTTMNILCGVLAPHGGTVDICGFNLGSRAIEAKRHLGYLPETPPLHVDATVDEFLLYCASLRGLKKSEARSAAARAKRNCDLDDVGSRLIGNLSKGYRQRVGIAQALLHDPAVVVLDEPTSGLDPNQIRTVRDTIRALAQHHAVILSTHVLSEAQTLCNRVTILHHGRIAFDRSIAREHDVMSVRFAAADAAPDWTSFADVIDAEALGDGRYRLHVRDFDRTAEMLCELAVSNRWGLRELARDSSPLEQVFVDLTCNDDTGGT